jgi:organic hydroperoxide reductase OsmC/OhrA
MESSLAAEPCLHRGCDCRLPTVNCQTKDTLVHLEHSFAVQVDWTGNRGTGTSDYKAYGREHVLSTEGAPDIVGSSDTVFRGDADRWNPEEMLIGALAQCHLLSYLHVAASHGVVVTAYRDEAVGTMEQTRNGGGHFTSVTLKPVVTISSDDADLALRLHAEASTKCFIAASMNFPVGHEPTILMGS